MPICIRAEAAWLKALDVAMEDGTAIGGMLCMKGKVGGCMSGQDPAARPSGSWP